MTDQLEGWCAVLGSEAVFFSLVVRQWTDAVPEAVWSACTQYLSISWDSILT